MRSLFALAAALTTACAADVAPEVGVVVDVQSVPADGLSAAVVTATVSPDDAVVTFGAGIGLLSATTARAVDGVATVSLIAPFESELVGASATTTVTASVTVDEQIVSAAVDVEFVFPTTGAPVLRARTEPDRVVAGSGESITVIVRGQRLAGTTGATSVTATLSADSDVVDVPESVELLPADAAPFYAEVTVRAPEEAANVVVTIEAGGAVLDVTLRFVAAGAPAFDLTGSFAQLTHGTVEIGDFPLLDGDNQCVIATTVNLVTIVQDGAHLTVHTESCEIKMPGVKLIGMGTITPTVSASFVAAANEAAGPELAFDLGAVGAGAPFDPPASAHHPLIVGARLNDEEDPLPTDGGDPRVVDADHDGNPGVTIMAGEERFTAYRTRVVEMSGTIQGSDRIDGEILTRTESVILNGGAFGGIGPRITDQPSPFRFERVDGENGAVNIAARDGDASAVSCADVLAFRDEMLTTFPAPQTRTACR